MQEPHPQHHSSACLVPSSSKGQASLRRTQPWSSPPRPPTYDKHMLTGRDTDTTGTSGAGSRVGPCTRTRGLPGGRCALESAQAHMPPPPTGSDLGPPPSTEQVWPRVPSACFLTVTTVGLRIRLPGTGTLMRGSKGFWLQIRSAPHPAFDPRQLCS